MRHLLLISLLFLCTSIFSQQEKGIQITVNVEGEDKEKIDNAYLLNVEQNQLLGTTSEGKTLIEVGNLPFTLSISHISYETKLIYIDKNSLAKMRNSFSVVMKKKVVEIKEVEINSNKSNLAYYREEDNVEDFEFYGNNILLLLKAGKRSKLRLINDNSVTLFDLNIPDKAKKLYKDCFNNLHVVYKDSMFQILFDEKQFSLVNGYTTIEYESSLFKCSASNSTSFILGFVDSYEQEVFYFIKNFDSTNYRFLKRSVDAQTKFRAQCIEKGIIKNNMSGASAAGSNSLEDIQAVYDLDRAITYFKYVDSSPLYSPIFTINENYLMFDHIKDTLYIFDKSGQPIKEMAISHQKSPGWKNKLYIDYLNGKIYAELKLRNKRFIKRLDLINGKLAQEQFRFSHDFPEKIQVKNNKVYYLYRENHQTGLPQKLFVFSLD